MWLKQCHKASVSVRSAIHPLSKIMMNGAQMLHGAGIFTYIDPKFHPNVGNSTIHGAYGLITNH